MIACYHGQHFVYRFVGIVIFIEHLNAFNEYAVYLRLLFKIVKLTAEACDITDSTETCFCSVHIKCLEAQRPDIFAVYVIVYDS